MNCAFLLLPLLSIPASPPKVISTQRRLFLVLSVLFFCDSLFGLRFLFFALLSKRLGLFGVFSPTYTQLFFLLPLRFLFPAFC